MRLNKADLIKMLKAFAYVSSATVLTGIVLVLADPEAVTTLPAWVGPLVPALNIFLYGALRFISDNRK